MRMRLTPLALLLLSAPLAAQAGSGMGMDKGKMDKGSMKMMDHSMPAVSFTGVAPHTASGSYQVVVKGDQHWIKISDDFKSTNSPDGFVYLAHDGKVDASAMELGELKGGQGGGSFEITDPKKAMEYNTVVIWSKAHSAAVATGSMHQMMKHDGMMKHDSGMMSHDTGMKHQ